MFKPQLVILRPLVFLFLLYIVGISSFPYYTLFAVLSFLFIHCNQGTTSKETLYPLKMETSPVKVYTRGWRYKVWGSNSEFYC